MSEIIYRGAVLSLERLEGRWEVVRHAAGVAILVLDGERVLGVRQHRPAIGGSSWELPAGMVDRGETPEQAALRELAEEANLCGHLEQIACSYPSPGYCDEIIYLYRASEIEPAHGELDDGEVLDIEWRDVREVWREARSGRLPTSSVTLLALCHALAEIEGAAPHR